MTAVVTETMAAAVVTATVHMMTVPMMTVAATETLTVAVTGIETVAAATETGREIETVTGGGTRTAPRKGTGMQTRRPKEGVGGMVTTRESRRGVEEGTRRMLLQIRAVTRSFTRCTGGG
jgi:hypothetical protein